MNARSIAWQLSVFPVWILVAVGVMISLLQPARLQGLTITLIAGILATFLAQLATRQPAGFVDRARLTAVGVVALVALGGIIALIAG